MAEACFCALFDESFGGGIAPAAFVHEAVPDFDLLRRGPVAIQAAPFQDFLVGATRERALRELIEIDSKKFAHSLVEGAVAREVAQVIAFGQFAFLGVEPDFVEDAAKDGDAADQITRGTNGKCHAPF